MLNVNHLKAIQDKHNTAVLQEGENMQYRAGYEMATFKLFGLLAVMVNFMLMEMWQQAKSGTMKFDKFANLVLMLLNKPCGIVELATAILLLIVKLYLRVIMPAVHSRSGIIKEQSWQMS